MLCLVALTLVCLCLVGQCIGQLGLVTERNNSHHGHQSGSSSWRTKSSHVPQTCNSTIILVAGRSASGSTALTLLQSSSLQYCRGRKEAFRQAPPTERTLQNCIRRSPHGSLLHVKQAHIEGHVIFGKDQPDTLQNSLQFFEAAKRSGYMKVITGYRPNVLDKMISSYELHITGTIHSLTVHARHRPTTPHPTPPSPHRRRQRCREEARSGVLELVEWYRTPPQVGIHSHLRRRLPPATHQDRRGQKQIPASGAPCLRKQGGNATYTWG